MLLEPRKAAPLERLYAAYGRRLLRRHFAAVRVGGADFPAGDGPVIAAPNHPSWWDPIVALFLSHDLFRRDGYGIMVADSLVRYPFFRRVGCFGATTDSLDDARKVAELAARLLCAGSRRALWVFPQGELAPARAPLRFRSGTARIARLAPDAPIVPLALRYELRAAQYPELFVRVGAAVPAGTAGATGPGALTRELERRVGAELAQLDADLAAERVDGYRVVLAGRGSVSEKWYAGG